MSRLQGIIATLVLLATTLPAAGQSVRERLESAQRSIESGDYAGAIEQYDAARALLPEEAAIPYNMAVAAYRQGELAQAGELFEEAIRLARDEELRSKATFNLGNASYAQALQALQGEADPEAAQDALGTATEQLEGAIDRYQDALRGDPGNEDARANAELAQRVLRQLEAMRDQMQQQSQDQQQDQDQQDQDPQNQDQREQPHDQEGQDQQQQPQGQDQQPQDQQSQQPQDQQQTQAEDAEQEQGEEPQPAPQEEDEAESQDQPEPSPSDQQDQTEEEQGGAAAGASEERPEGMDREQAERLLQRVRDKDRERRQQQLANERARHRPAEKDW